MDLEKGTETLDKADGFLTKLKTLLKKHWGILLILLLGFGVYKFVVAVGEEMDNPTTIEEPYYEEPYYEDYNQEDTYQSDEYYDDTYYEEE
jgi:hypothetical protein